VRAARIARVVAIAILAAVAASCTTTATARFYTLGSTATADGAASSAPGSVMIGPVTIPAAVDRPEFVIQVAPNRVEVEEFTAGSRRLAIRSRGSSPATWS